MLAVLFGFGMTNVLCSGCAAHRANFRGARDSNAVRYFPKTYGRGWIIDRSRAEAFRESGCAVIGHAQRRHCRIAGRLSPFRKIRCLNP